jgi:hypothetical protein
VLSQVLKLAIDDGSKFLGGFQQSLYISSVGQLDKLRSAVALRPAKSRKFDSVQMERSLEFIGVISHR